MAGFRSHGDSQLDANKPEPNGSEEFGPLDSPFRPLHAMNQGESDKPNPAQAQGETNLMSFTPSPQG